MHREKNSEKYISIKIPFGSGEESVTTDYLEGFQYESKQVSSNTPVIALKFVPTAEGYYNFENNKYIYNYTDHLGNVRLSYFNNGSGAEVLEENNYYPFGLKHEGYNALAGNPAYKYSYNGKESQTESGMYDYGARFYMADIGRWGVVDPLAEKYYNFSPFNYVLSNPVNYIDPFGMDVYKLGTDGSIEWVSESKEDQIYAADQFNKNNSLIEKAQGFTVGEQGYISKNTISGSFTDSEGNEKKYSLITFKNKDTALGLHEYISNNVNAEFMIGTGLKNGEEQSIVGKNGALDKPANKGSVSISPYLDYFDNNTITLFGHNHPDNKYEIEPSGYEVELKSWKSNDFKNISVGRGLNNGDYNTSDSFPKAATLFMYNPKYYIGPKNVIYNKEGVKTINNGYYKKSKK